MSRGRRYGRRVQGWLLIGYSLLVLATNAHNGMWRRVSIGAAASVILTVAFLMVRARLRGECPCAMDDEDMARL